MNKCRINGYRAQFEDLLSQVHLDADEVLRDYVSLTRELLLELEDEQNDTEEKLGSTPAPAR